jgi:hypothetical protein
VEIELAVAVVAQVRPLQIKMVVLALLRLLLGHL